MAGTTVKFSNGREVPVFGLGTWQSKPGEVAEAVKTAIGCGYRHIDGAFLYLNEDEVGTGIHAKIEDGTIKREDVFITTKLGFTFHEKERVMVCLKKSLAALKLDYVDLFLMHSPVGLKCIDGSDAGALDPKNLTFDEIDFMDTYKGMEACVDAGLTKSIGLSNFNHEQIERVLANCRIKPVMLQVEIHPYFSQAKLLAFCKERDIIVTAYSPLGSPGGPRGSDNNLLEEPQIKAIAAKYGKSAGQVLLRWAVQRGTVAIPKSVTASRIQANIQIFDFELSDGEMTEINSMNKNKRLFESEGFKAHKYYPFSAEY